MAWLQKVLGGKKENAALTLKLRLNRWRHFLRTEWACQRLLDDLKEKSQGEYIFDRQYIFSTVSRIFQQAFQAAYDGTLLVQKSEAGLYFRLDQLKEEAMSFLSGYSRGKTISKNNGADKNPVTQPSSAEGQDLEEWLDLDQEPEFQMLKGVIKILDSNHGNDKLLPAEKNEGGQNIRTALQWIHEQVLSQLIHQEEVKHWLSTGLAVSRIDEKPGPFQVIDLGKEANLGHRHKESFSFPAWSLVEEALSTLLKNGPGDSGKWPLTFLVILNESAVFIMGSSSGTRLFLDVVLTNVRELNHFFFRLQKDSETGPGVIKTTISWDWTYQRDGEVFEWAAYQKPAREIEGYVIQLGHS
jgi:hypothetical protein